MHTCSAIGFALMVCHRRLILHVLDHYSSKHQTRLEMHAQDEDLQNENWPNFAMQELVCVSPNFYSSFCDPVGCYFPA